MLSFKSFYLGHFTQIAMITGRIMITLYISFHFISRHVDFIQKRHYRINIRSFVLSKGTDRLSKNCDQSNKIDLRVCLIACKFIDNKTLRFA